MPYSPTVVETVSINFDDFNESFLTCSTCLYPFDANNRKPKLLSCSHTVCSTCLGAIADLPRPSESGSIRCPICREVVTIPRGGILALPPSFMVNQLIDLLNGRKRDLIPKCPLHSNEELLFCETCDKVFCPSCCETNECLNHTVVPFSVAIKRMSEIMLYKANQCIKTLNKAAANVQRELKLLEQSVESVTVDIDNAFSELNKIVEQRKAQLLQLVSGVKEAKGQVLQVASYWTIPAEALQGLVLSRITKPVKDQLNIIQLEKMKIEMECIDFQKELNVRTLTRYIGALNEKLDSSLSLMEPRENSFVCFERESGVSDDSANLVEGILLSFGSVTVSKTFPMLCVADVGPATKNLLCSVLLTTVDYEGLRRNTGGDPVCALLSYLHPEATEKDLKMPVDVIDNGDGTYELTYIPRNAGFYRMEVTIFDRYIKNSPLFIDVSPHNNALWQYSGSNKGDSQDAAESLLQPVRVAVFDQLISILDTGHNCLKVLNPEGMVVRLITGTSLADQGAVGLAIGKVSDNALITLNWRSKLVTEWTWQGEEVKTFTFSEFVEPIDLTIDLDGRIIVLDNGRAKVFVFDRRARPLFSFPLQKNNCPQQSSGRQNSHANCFGFTCVTVGPNRDILVGGCEVQIYSHGGTFLFAFPVESATNICLQPVVVGGLAVDLEDKLVLATVTNRKSSCVMIFNYDGTVANQIDSFNSKLRRPSGICTVHDRCCLVADLGNNCIKKYRYK
ncbi:tripartite motif containing protein 2 [Trichuris trichiura]|uniref:Tripartite motif containing protein 2 n=1 Tax=Trichuris trichiura TaxID=36087 RepID=A0A077Z3N5_TRITR|nr:tripartite motif containing protein 2 [Trichuris trichiura]